MTMGLPVVLDAARAHWRGPLEILMAAGHGRSYGIHSTVLGPAQLAEVEKLGCAFAVSPGVTPSLLDAAKIGHAFENPSAIGGEHGGRKTQVELMNLVVRNRCRDPVDIGFGGHIPSLRRRARCIVGPAALQPIDITPAARGTDLAAYNASQIIVTDLRLIRRRRPQTSRGSLTATLP